MLKLDKGRIMSRQLFTIYIHGVLTEVKTGTQVMQFCLRILSKREDAVSRVSVEQE